VASDLVLTQARNEVGDVLALDLVLTQARNEVGDVLALDLDHSAVNVISHRPCVLF
jgi:hypothetical protein